MDNRLAIAIVTFERPSVTQRCIDSIRRATQTPYVIYLADNGSRSAEALSSMDRWKRDNDIVLLRLPTNGGPSVGRNVILERVRGRHDFVATLDNDCIVLSDWNTAALAALHDGYDVVCPKLLSHDLTRVERGPTRPWPVSWLVHPEYVGRGCGRHDPLVSSRTDVGVFPGVAVFRTSVFDRAGLFDPRIWLGEDYELAFRAVAVGARICYEPTCEIVHDHVFDPAYEQVRHDPCRALASHFVIWQKHRKLLLSPAALRLYCRLAKNAEPMWIPKQNRFDKLGARLRRRIVRKYLCKRYGEVWASLREGQRMTLEVAAELSWDLGSAESWTAAAASTCATEER